MKLIEPRARKIAGVLREADPCAGARVDDGGLWLFTRIEVMVRIQPNNIERVI